MKFTSRILGIIFIAAVINACSSYEKNNNGGTTVATTPAVTNGPNGSVSQSDPFGGGSGTGLPPTH